MPSPFDPPVVDLSPEQVAAERSLYGGLAESVRRLMEASLRTSVDPEDVAGATRRVDEICEVLERDRIPGGFGVDLTPDGHVRAYGNAVVGLRNPIALPLQIQHEPTGRAHAEFTLGALHEGPPGCVHGGVIALLIDQVAGEATAAAGSPGMTGTLTIRYVRPTRLGECSVACWLERSEGSKTVVRGEFRDAKDRVTAEAEGIFILPQWARDAIADGAPVPRRFE